MSRASIPAAQPHVVVTGASGYVGKRFCALAAARGWQVTALSRRPPRTHTPLTHVAYSLEGKLAPLPDGVTAVLHLAYDTESKLPEHVEIDAASALLEAAKRAGAERIVFASSQTAANPVSRYGRVKRAIEDVFSLAGGSVVRPGLVYGGPRSQGLFATFWRLARLPVRFVPMPMPQIHPIHVDDLCEALLVLCDPARPRVPQIEVAGPPLPFAALLEEMSRDQGIGPQLPLPVPLFLIVPVVELAGRFAAILAWLAERLQSFAALAPIAGEQGLVLLGVNARPLRDGLRPSSDARRRDLLLEGRALLRYAGGFAPGPALLARYVRAVENLDDGRALALATLVSRFPGLGELRPPAPAALHDPALERRLDLAVSLSETTPDGARTFLAPASSSRLALVAGLTLATLREGGRRAAQLALYPVLVRQGRARRRALERR